jgi:hypothetical protein
VANIVKNTRVEVAKDGKSARVTGEWAAGPEVVSKAAGGSEMTIPVIVTEEMTVTAAPKRNYAAGVMDASGQILVKLPPQPLGSPDAGRKIDVDVGLNQPTGLRVSIARGPLDAAGTWSSAPVPIGGKPHIAQATAANGMVRVVFAVPKK